MFSRDRSELIPCPLHYFPSFLGHGWRCELSSARSHSSSAEALNRQSLPIFIAGIVPAPARRLTVFGWTWSTRAASSALISGSHITLNGALHTEPSDRL